MIARATLDGLPAELGPVVIFRIAAFQPLAEDSLLRAMFGLPVGWTSGPDSHVVLSRQGPLLRHAASGQLRFATEPDQVVPYHPHGLGRLLETQLSLLPGTEPDCLGVGVIPGQPPVALHATVDGMVAHGTAVLSDAPAPEHTELLGAVGVSYLGGRFVGRSFIARFTNRLDQHLTAGALAGSSRTDHCNLFFLRHARTGPDLDDGLVRAAQDRIRHGHARVLAAAEMLAIQALATPLALTCIPPPPGRPEPYGDLVPLGFLAGALTGTPTGDRVRDHLAGCRRGGLWSYHSGGLPTATDTGYVAHALDDPLVLAETARALPAFAGPNGGYLPQRHGDQPEPGVMVPDDSNRHWCREDYATTCLVTALRHAAGYPIDAELAWLTDRFEDRHGLFVANPLLVDWALARALAPGRSLAAGAEGMRRDLAERLRTQLLAAQHPDGSFGTFDRPFSTALAVLALQTLGSAGRPVLRAQIRLLDWISPAGLAPVATPFFSAVARQDDPNSPPDYDLTWYRDERGLLTVAVAASALAVPAEPTEGAAAVGTPQRCPHRSTPQQQQQQQQQERYRHPDHASYVRQHALGGVGRSAYRAAGLRLGQYGVPFGPVDRGQDGHERGPHDRAVQSDPPQHPVADGALHVGGGAGVTAG